MKTLRTILWGPALAIALLASAGTTVLAQDANPARAPHRPDAGGWWSPDAPARSGVPYGLGVDYSPQRLDAYFPAGGALSQFTDRAGAWYAIFYVPLPARWPVEVWIWQRSDSHQARVLALDGWPGSSARVAVPLPVKRETGPHGRPVLTTAPFALSAESSAEGVFLLLSQWEPHGTRPPPVWLQVRTATASASEYARTGRPWWSSAPDPAEPTSDPYVSPPAGPLSSPKAAPSVIELPIRRLTTPPPRVAIPFEPWWDR